jgi:Spy/CpxP family protein refolding chaperone
MEEDDMSEDKAGSGPRPLFSRRSFWLGGGALLGLASLGAAAFVPVAKAHGFGRHFGHGHGHGFGQRMLADPEQAKDHLAAAVEWGLRGVDGTDDQKAQARRITDRLVDELAPLAAKHQEQREAIRRALTGATVDREALEAARAEEMKLADQFSRVAVRAVADLADVLRPEQRAELLRFIHRLHGRG